MFPNLLEVIILKIFFEYFALLGVTISIFLIFFGLDNSFIVSDLKLHFSLANKTV